LPNKFSEAIEEVAKPKPNTQMQGAVHAKTPGYNPFPTINMNLNRSNVTLDFKYDGENKTLYSVLCDLWDPVKPETRQKYKDAGKVDAKGNVRVMLTPEQKAEIINMDPARFPDHTYKYMISYTHMKRMYGNDGNEYLVRYGYFHGVSFMSMEWKHFKMDFDFHYEPIFEQTPTLTGSSFDINFGDITRQIKVYHTPWNTDEFEKSLKDIPFPNNTSLGVAFNIGIEGAPGVYPIPDVKAFKSKSFEELMQYVQENDIELLKDNTAKEAIVEKK
jgi:hypothetical protein